MPTLWVYTDGSARPNNAFGQAGAGIVVISGDTAYGFSKYLGQGTNNFAELTAMQFGLGLALEGLSHVPDWKTTVDVLVLSDSEYAINSVNGTWNLTPAKKNYQLIAAIKAEIKKFPRIRFQHVYGHASNEWNNWADELSVQGHNKEEARHVRKIGTVLQKDTAGSDAGTVQASV